MRKLRKLMVAAIIAAGTLASTQHAEAQGIGLSVGGGGLSGIRLGLTGRTLVPTTTGVGVPISTSEFPGFSSVERQARFQAYLDRRRQRRQAARSLLRQRSRTPSGAFNPGYTLPPDLSTYSFLSTDRGFVTGTNLESRLRRQLKN